MATETPAKHCFRLLASRWWFSVVNWFRTGCQKILSNRKCFLWDFVKMRVPTSLFKLWCQRRTTNSPPPARPPPTTPLLGSPVGWMSHRATVSRLITEMEALLTAAQPQQTHLMARNLAAEQSVFGHLPVSVEIIPELQPF